MKKRVMLFLINFLMFSSLCFADSLKESVEEPDNQTEKKPTQASSPLTGTFDLTSNYVFRGLSETDNLAAAQGGFTLTVPKGFYANIWGSNVNFFAYDAYATIELDTVGGVKNDINDHLSYNLNFTRYNYPQAQNLSYNEFNAAITYRFLTGLIGYSTNVFNSGTTGIYTNLGAGFDLPAKYIHFEEMSFNAGIGYYHLDPIAGNSYVDYSISIAKAIKNFTAALQWTNTNHRFYDNKLDHAQLFGTLTATF